MTVDPTRRDAILLAAGASVIAPPAFAAAPMCKITPRLTEGPFYVARGLDRRDIRDGRLGTPLEVELSVVDVAAACRPVGGALIDIWHCDAQGVYSGFGQGQGRGFLRGRQTVGADGKARFTTIWPGWYPGRSPHIHFKVWLSQRDVLTGQLFFPDAVSEAVYAAPAYRRMDRGYTRNDADFIAGEARGAATAAVTRAAGGGNIAALTIGLARA